jgi:hypothetical protein
MLQSVSNQDDYKYGAFLGALFVSFGLLAGIFWFGSLPPMFGPKEFTVQATWILLFVSTSVLLIRKGKIGLRLVYFWSAVFWLLILHRCEGAAAEGER